MKRIGYLFDQAISYENLLTAFRLAMKGCGNTYATCRFSFHLEKEILKLRKELKEGTYRPGAYQYFKIRDPKERVIAVAPFRDRVVHHAVVRIMTPHYERIFIHDSYATRAGKGTHAAILRAQTFLRKWPWYLKTDIDKYFENVNHNILIELLKRKIKDRRFLELMAHIIRNTPEEGRGLPIGNLTSQFLANVYLDPFDHEIKDKRSIRGYLRFMDDSVLFCRSRDELLTLRSVVEDYLKNKLKLRLKPGATWINRSSHGLSFLGMRIFPRFIRIKPANRRRSLKKLSVQMKAYKSNRVDEQSLVRSVDSIVGHLRYFCPDMKINLETGKV